MKKFQLALRAWVLFAALGITWTLLPAQAFAANSPDFNVWVGSTEQVVSVTTKAATGLQYWPDGLLGILPNNGGGYLFFGANASSVARTTGSLSNPLSGSVSPSTPVQNMRNVYNYTAGGPVYRDPNSGMLLLIYHAERWPNGDATQFYASLGMARSLDNGVSWTDLGEIISPNVPYSPTSGPHIEVGGGPYAIVNGNIEVYFHDLDIAGNATQLGVARANLASLVSAARNQNTVIPFTKYYNGAWSQPALGGLSSPLEVANLKIGWFDVTWNQAVGQYLVVGATKAPNGFTNLFMLQSSDSVSWSNRRQLTSDTNYSWNPTIVGTGSNPRVTGNGFYVYHNFGMNRWTDSDLVRRLIYVW